MNRALINLRGLSAYLIPRKIYQNRLEKIFLNLAKKSDDYLINLKKRVNFYNKINHKFTLTNEKESIHKFPFHQTTYYFDSYEISKYFKDGLFWLSKFGDIKQNLNEPSLCKSRLIDEKNFNNILLKLDKERHFCFFKDELKFSEKIDKAIFRGNAPQKHRQEFLKANLNSKFCDLGETGAYVKELKAKFLSKKKQVKYKFIISLEGNDVASNLKWAMFSNSLVLSPKLTCETWFMESKLKENFHFVLVDKENLDEKVEYYLKNQNEALEIINNAHKFILPFLDKQSELECALLVLAKYFYYSQQMEFKPFVLEFFK